MRRASAAASGNNVLFGDDPAIKKLGAGHSGDIMKDLENMYSQMSEEQKSFFTALDDSTAGRNA